jgi:indole-3-glycerol phosphate synthase
MILDDIVAFKEKQLKEIKQKVTMEQIIELSLKRDINTIRDFKGALNKEKISIISEIKKASPSRGIIKEDFDVEKIAKVYEEIDIDAVSVLTETEFFKGSPENINIAKKVCSKPMLRKDFVIDEYQVYEAKAIGGDGILLIAAILKNDLKRFYDLAKSIGLHPLVEVHNKEELGLALDADCDIIGINNRDLKTFKENLKTTESLIKYIPKDKIVVSESSIKTPEDIVYLKGLGVKAVLIGETFMRKIEDRNSLDLFIEQSKK